MIHITLFATLLAPTVAAAAPVGVSGDFDCNGTLDAALVFWNEDTGALGIEVHHDLPRADLTLGDEAFHDSGLILASRDVDQDWCDDLVVVAPGVELSNALFIPGGASAGRLMPSAIDGDLPLVLNIATGDESHGDVAPAMGDSGFDTGGDLNWGWETWTCWRYCMNIGGMSVCYTCCETRDMNGNTSFGCYD